MKSENLQKWALTAEIVGGLAVIATLLILILEVRDNTGAMKLQAQDSARDRIQELGLFIAQNPDVWAKSLFDPGSLTREELIVATYISSLQRNHLVAAYNAFENGIITEEDWKTSLSGSARLNFGYPLGNVFWEFERDYLMSSNREDLARQIDEELATSSVMTELEWTQFIEAAVEAEFN
jgi:hypothetical protein